MFSIWRKMQTSRFRWSSCQTCSAIAVVADEAACYQALGAASQFPLRTRALYIISQRLLNGYQSLHTTVIGPNQQRVEVQIRTEHMHDIAERGGRALDL